MSNCQQESNLKLRYIEPEPPLAFFSFEQTPLQEVIEDLPDGYYEVNLRGDLIAFNRALCRIHGYAPEIMINMNYKDYTPADMHGAVLQVYNNVYNTGRPVQILDFQVTRTDGSICIVDTSVHLIRDKKGFPAGFRGISRDVTEQKRNEAYEKARARILEKIARNASLEDTLKAILESLSGQMTDFSGVFYNEADGELHCAASVNVPEAFIRLTDGEKISPEGKIASRTAFRREPVIVECVKTDDQCRFYLDDLLGNGIQAIWSYPVMAADNRLAGVLEIYPGNASAPLDIEAVWIQSAVATAEIAFFHHCMTSKLVFLSRHDSLTGIINRHSFLTDSERLLNLARRKGWRSSMMFLDLNRFKEVNDTWGHHTGDLLLVETAGRLTGCLRQYDCLARMGGDEFAVFISEAGTNRAQIVAARISKAMAEPFTLNGIIIRVGVSIGISIAIENQEIAVDTLLIQADEAMYRAKSNGLSWAFHNN